MAEGFESMVSSSITLDTPTSFTKQAYSLLIGPVGYALRDSCSAPRYESHQPFRRRPNYSLRRKVVFVKAVSSTLLLRMSGAGKAARATAPVSISA
jgi:hypothetical protein